MADTKLADLPALTTPTGDDILYIVDDPGGATPADKKLALDNLFTRGTVTADSPVINASQTWNNSGVTFTGLKFNAGGSSDANSAAGSLLMDLQVGGTSKFNVSKSGDTYTAVSLTIRSATLAALGGVNRLAYGSSSSTSNVYTYWNPDDTQPNMRFRSTWGIGWTSNSLNPVDNTFDTIITRKAAANLRLGAADTGAVTATVTITIAAPGVVTWTSHTLSTGTPVVFTTTGALPTGITAGTTYYAIVVDANTFQLATSVNNALAGTAITTSGSQSGTHTGTRYNITQRLSVQSNTGVTDRLGADLFIQGSQGTGTGAGGSIVFQVAPAGSTGTAQNALATALTIGSDKTITAVGGYTNSIFQVAIAYAGTTSGIRLANASPLEWSSSSTCFGSADVLLYRDAANTLALRNSTSAQRFNIYGTYTASDNFERLFLEYNSAGTAFRIGTEKGASGGTARVLDLVHDGISKLRLASASINISGDFSVGTWLGLGGNISSAASNGWIKSQADGIIGLYNNATTDFNRIQFGGTTSSFPALKRVSASLSVRLADDSADAAITASTGTFSDNTVNSSLIAGSGYSLTGSSAVAAVDLAGTWNTTGAPTGIKLNITNTASGAASLLMDLGTTDSSVYNSRFSVTKVGGVTANSITLTGDISSAAWTTNGLRYKNVAGTFTDTTSSGTVAAAYTNAYGGNTIAASNSVTFTDYYTTYITQPTAGTNVTLTNKWALGLGGSLAIADAGNIAVGTSTGTKIGTSTSQKIGFWNATPIVQPTTGVASATVAATGTGDVVAASTTFDGYTIPQIVKALRNAGLLA